MEDDKSTETSTNEEALDTEAELENDETSFDEASEDDETEESSEFEEDESANESTEDEQEESEEDVDEEAKGEDTDPEAQRREAARKAFEEREANRLAREEAKREAQDKYLAEADNNHDLAVRQLQIDAYNNRVLTNTNTLQNGIDKAVAHIDLFKTGSVAQKEELADALDNFERMYVQRDRNGDPVAVQGDVFEYLQKESERIKRIARDGAQQQLKAKGNTKARTLSTPSRKPKEATKDPYLEGFDEEADRW